MFRWTIDVGWTNTRPVKPEQFISRVTVMEETESQAIITACAMVRGRSGSWIFGPACEMPTSTRIVEVEL